MADHFNAPCINLIWSWVLVNRHLFGIRNARSSLVNNVANVKDLVMAIQTEQPVIVEQPSGLMKWIGTSASQLHPTTTISQPTLNLVTSLGVTSFNVPKPKGWGQSTQTFPGQ